MAEYRYLDDDVVKLCETTSNGTSGPLRATLFWGDRIGVTGKRAGKTLVELPRREWNAEKKRYEWKTYECALPAKAKFRDTPLLKVRFVDVGQGDAAIVESPRGALVLIDGGEASHMRHYVNAAYSHLLRRGPLSCAAIVVTHGDADHFAGLTELLEARRTEAQPLIVADRVFHNGMVKGPAALGQKIFGRTTQANGATYVTALEDDLREVADARLNRPFVAWKKAVTALRTSEGRKPRVRRLGWGDDDAFDFLADEGIRTQVIGPIVEAVGGRPALPFLRTPGSRSLSASHTINGHSVVLKMTYGNVRFLFGADLNEESEERLLQRARESGLSLAAEVLKVPHHGSADFSPRMLEAIRPVVSVVSSGDENVAQEYIHPRAGLVGALGKFSRATVDKPLVYVTEMVAFFARDNTRHNGYVKTQFGIVHVRTDGQRVLVTTHSGKDDRKESYVFHVDERGDAKFSEEPSIL